MYPRIENNIIVRTLIAYARAHGPPKSVYLDDQRKKRLQFLRKTAMECHDGSDDLLQIHSAKCKSYRLKSKKK